MTYSIKQDGDIGVITINGELTAEYADKFKSALAQFLGSGRKAISLDFEGVEKIDLACLKLLCAAHRSSSKRNRKLSLTGIRPDVFRKTVKEAGYCRHIGCGSNNETECLWTGM